MSPSRTGTFPLCSRFAADIHYDGANKRSIAYDSLPDVAFCYDGALMTSAGAEQTASEVTYSVFSGFATLLAAEGPVTVGDILAGHSSDTMIHLTTATEDELATATFPNFTPPHTTPGVFQGSSWVQLGDVSHMTLPEYQELVVGPSAAGYGSDVSAFVTHPPSSVFTPVNVPNLGGVQEFINGAVVKPGTYVPLPGKP